MTLAIVETKRPFGRSKGSGTSSTETEPSRWSCTTWRTITPPPGLGLSKVPSHRCPTLYKSRRPVGGSVTSACRLQNWGLPIRLRTDPVHDSHFDADAGQPFDESQGESTSVGRIPIGGRHNPHQNTIKSGLIVLQLMHVIVDARVQVERSNAYPGTSRRKENILAAPGD